MVSEPVLELWRDTKEVMSLWISVTSFTSLPFLLNEGNEENMVSTKIKDAKKVLKSNYVYVLVNDMDMVKIGITDSPYDRFTTIQNTSGSFIKQFYLSDPISNNYEIEQYLHKHFKKYNTVAEWYRNIPFDNVVDFVSKYINEKGNKINSVTYAIVKKKITK